MALKGLILFISVLHLRRSNLNPEFFWGLGGWGWSGGGGGGGGGWDAKILSLSMLNG